MQTGEPIEANPEERNPDAPPWSRVPVMIIMGLFIGAALLIPPNLAQKIGAFFGEAPVRIEGTFSDRAAALDEALAGGEPVDASEVRALRHELMLRRILRAGPMTGEHLRRAKAMLVDLDAKLAIEKTAPGREALRHAKARELARAFPRLDAAALTRELDLFAAQYQRAMARIDSP